jgi:hypothetical protein
VEDESTKTIFIKVEDVQTLCGPEKDAARSKPKLI